MSVIVLVDPTDGAAEEYTQEYPTATGNCSAAAGTTPGAELALGPEVTREFAADPEVAALLAVAGPEVDVLADVLHPAKASPVIAASAAFAVMCRTCVFTPAAYSRRLLRGPETAKTGATPGMPAADDLAPARLDPRPPESVARYVAGKPAANSP